MVDWILLSYNYVKVSCHLPRCAASTEKPRNTLSFKHDDVSQENNVSHEKRDVASKRRERAQIQAH